MVIINIIFSCFKLFLRFKKVRLINVGFDQNLLFEGASSRLIWETENCLFVKVKIEGLASAYISPDGIAIISIYKGLDILVIAYGPFGSTQYNIKPIVQSLNLTPPGANGLLVIAPMASSTINELNVMLDSSPLSSAELIISTPDLVQGISLLDLSTEKLLAEMLETHL